MLIRGIRQLGSIVVSVVFITSLLALVKIYNGQSVAIPYLTERWGEDSFPHAQQAAFDHSLGSTQDPLADSDPIPTDNDEFDLNVYGKDVHEVFSVSTRNRKYFPIVFGNGFKAMNPNIIPHPEDDDTWVVVAQQLRSEVVNTVWSVEIVCNAKFIRGKLTCVTSPVYLPIAPTFSIPDMCDGNLYFLDYNVGPHDARMFYGPENPYAIWGSQSRFTCFGQFIQDIRFLTDWGITRAAPTDPKHPFLLTTELQRPVWGKMEKNWFLFWDEAGQMYLHYDIQPKRSFAALAHDGSAGIDLAPQTELDDGLCMAKYMPKLADGLESIHQATNSLKVTLCKRADPACKPDNFNTYIMHIFHHKTYYNFHSVYEPYVMLFQQNAPFALHAVSRKPIWIHGRGKAPRPADLNAHDTWDETEMFYVTSMSWRSRAQKYHGYMDDVMFLAIGIEDKRSAGIDVVVADILDHLGLCSDKTPLADEPPHVHALKDTHGTAGGGGGGVHL